MNRYTTPNATMGYPGRPANGGSNPRFYDFDDGVKRLVKWQPSVHGAKACYNELLASHLGQLLDAPLLRGAVVFVPDEIIPGDHRQVGATEGFHFATAWMDGENFVPTQHYAEIANADELPTAAVFLAWLAVGDQDGHNQFLQRKVVTDTAGVQTQTKFFKLIDMGQAFGSFTWSAADVARVHTSYSLPPHMVAHLNLAKLADPIARLNALPNDKIERCLIDRPMEWNIPDADVGAIVTRLTAARDTITDILRTGNPAIT